MRYALLVVFCAVASLSAHHSATMFDSTKVKELSGTVKEFQWKNPHVWIQLNVQKAQAQDHKLVI